VALKSVKVPINIVFCKETSAMNMKRNKHKKIEKEKER